MTTVSPVLMTDEQRQRNIRLLDGMQPGTRFVAYRQNPYDRILISPNGSMRDPGPVKERCMKETDGNIFVFQKGRKIYGRRWSENSFLNTYVICEPRDEGEEWHKRLRRAVSCMEESGLWGEVKTVFSNLISVNYKDWKAMKDVYWSKRRFDAVTRKWVEKTGDEMDTAWRIYAEKYPFCFSTDSEGHLQIDTDYIFEMSECRLKSMYFGKARNAQAKELFKQAIETRTPFNTGRVRVNYDVSAQYDPEKQKAWYSEEYKDCGNGYYYLMLDHSTALFVEKD